MENFDVYSYGVIASSTLYLLDGPYPAQSGYGEIDKKYQHTGGEAANSSIVLSHLGLKVKLDGNWINPDEDAHFLQEVFARNQVDISRLSIRSCKGPKEVLMVDTNSRTIFGTYAQLHEEKSWNLPQKTDIQHAKVISIDPFFAEASIRAVEYAKSFNKPIVTIDCKFDDAVFLGSDIAIIAEEYLRYTYPDDNPQAIMQKYREDYEGTVIFTFGDREILFSSGDPGMESMVPYRIDPVDTTGAGDSFRAGIIYGVLQEWPIKKSVTFASALAAIVCQSIPGVLNSPSYEEVESFMNAYQSESAG